MIAMVYPHYYLRAIYIHLGLFVRRLLSPLPWVRDHEQYERYILASLAQTRQERREIAERMNWLEVLVQRRR